MCAVYDTVFCPLLFDNGEFKKQVQPVLGAP